MLKKFVPLDSEVEVSQTPYDIRTFKGPAYEDIPRPINIDPCCYGVPLKPCVPGKVHVAKPMTTEEAIFCLFEIPQKPKFQWKCKKRCKSNLEVYNTCVMDVKTPAALRHNAIMREKYLKVKAETMQRVHDAQEPSSDEASVVQIDSPIVGEARVQPKPCSPACSLDTFYVPSRRLLDLKRPRSGVFINESVRPVDSGIPYETYNPRQLQEKIESEDRKKYTLLSDGNRLYFPWMQSTDNMGEPKGEAALRQDCINFKPIIFPIPDDLHKTFRAAVVFGNEALFPHDESSGSHRPIEVACLYTAYVESFAKNPDYWSAKTMDGILAYAMQLIIKSIELRYENPSADFDVFPELTEKDSTVEMKLHLTGALIDEPNILKALTLFFNKYNAGVLVAESLYLLIWKRCANSFYIFDPNGRDMQCKRDFVAGKSSLIGIQTVEHIVHLILNYSDVKSEADFNLYEIHLKDFGKLSKPSTLQPLRRPRKLYAIVNRFYAVMPGMSGVTETKANENNPSMMIGYIALAYSQIDPPREWTVRLVDDLIKYGTKYYEDYMSDNRLKKFNIADLPEVLLFGNYRVVSDKKAFASSGHVVDCWSYRVSQLTLAISDFFTEYDSGILQLDGSCIALWREGHMLFAFDPFKRGPAGQAGVTGKHAPGCLQIHLNMDSLCRILFMNALVVKTDGNFFLHAIRIKAIGTFNVNRAMEDSTRFGKLHINYPFDCLKLASGGDAEEQGGDECPDTGGKGDINTITLVQCLSQLSVSPCKRTCSEREFVQQQRKEQARKKGGAAATGGVASSIQSIPDQYIIPDHDDVDVIDSVVGEFICDLMNTIQRKTEKKQKVHIEASKILLQSDKGHLEDLKLRLKRGEDYDNICAAFRTRPFPYIAMTVEEELAMESNFTALPDGTWAIFGTSALDPSNEALRGLLAVITAAALSSKYSVHTWSSDVIEYALEASGILEGRFLTYDHTLDLMFRKQLPKIRLGHNTYLLNIMNNETVVPDKLKSALESALLKVNRLFLICKGLSCMIMKRYNLIYMFMGCPCDVVGFRTKSAAPMCLLRFVEVVALVRRIDNACGRCGKYVIVMLDVKDITEPRPDRFIQRTASQEAMLYRQEFIEKQKQKQRYKDKLKFLQHELHKESKRLRRFEMEKHSKKGAKGKRLTITIPQHKSSTSAGADATTESGEFDEEEGVYEESERSVEYKHKPGRSLEKMVPEEEELVEQEEIVIPTLGYQLRDSDCLFKIQGTAFLEDRQGSATDKIKTCFFASSIALLYAILRPLNHWDSRRIDKVIHLAMNTAKTMSNFNTASERIIKNIDVDEFTFEVKIQAYTPMGTFGGNIEYKIGKTVQTQRYFLIQISNGTFGVYHDKYYHLFDPYPAMELAGANMEPEEVEPPKCPDHIASHPDQNTASWVLFPDLPAMMSYIGKRATSPDWRNEYQLHIVSIISYKTAPKRVQLLNLLTDEFNVCTKPADSANLCTHPEEIEWLDIYPNLVIWSRLNRSNAVQRVRGSAMTKDRNFDVEIPDKLYSLWGSLHPKSAVFGESRGKQHLAINVVACCVATVYQVHEWNTQLIDSIVINGNEYYNDSVKMIDRTDYEISLEHLNTEFSMGHLRFEVHLESVTYGYLYTREKNELNLAASLSYFFTHHRYGIIQCMSQSVAIGSLNSGFFMFECQNHGLPLFPTGQGAAYIMRATQLQTLLYCIVMTFNIPYYNAQFTIHKVEITSEKFEAQEEDQDPGDME